MANARARCRITLQVLCVVGVLYGAARAVLFDDFDCRSGGFVIVIGGGGSPRFGHLEVYPRYRTAQGVCETLFYPVDYLHLGLRRRAGVPDPPIRWTSH